MSDRTATAISCPNIALIKYWGNLDHTLRLPSSGSISMNLDGLFSHTRVKIDPHLNQDQFLFNGKPAGAEALDRVSALLNIIRSRAGLADRARVESYNNFPTGTGIASSASGFAALALAASRAAGLELDEPDLSRLARRASGSACRSIPGGFVEWEAGEDDRSSYAFSIAPADHWELVDCIAIISQEHKQTTSFEGHRLADSSPLQSARLIDAPRRLEICRKAILARDFDALAQVVELDSNLMHAVMITSTPPLLYWLPATIRVMQAVQAWRKEGLPACYTVDAGPNVHVICQIDAALQVTAKLNQMEGVQRVLSARPGGPAHIVSEAPNPVSNPFPR